jgi:hypothetical protein
MKPPTKSQQRYFGLAVAAAWLMLAWIAWRAFASIPLSSVLGLFGIVFASLYYSLPSSQQKLILVFRTITFPIQWIMTLIVLAIVYYVVLTPIAVWYRLSGKSIRKTDADTTSNWRPTKLPPDPDSYFRTF